MLELDSLEDCLAGNEDWLIMLHPMPQEEERPPTPPLDVKYYTRPDGQQLSVQLVTTHPLWVRRHPAQAPITFSYRLF